MSSAADILHAYISQFVSISKEDCTKVFSDWQIEPVEVDGAVVGAVITKGNEIHIAVEPQHWNRWATRRLSRKYLTDGLVKFGHLVTKVSKTNAIAAEFVERLGFYKTGEDGIFLTYRIDHAKIK